MMEYSSERVRVLQSSAQNYTRRIVVVDFLYLDNESCDRCMGTEAALEEALERVEPILGAFDTSVTVRDIHVERVEGAEATNLAVSPTIRIDGRDIQPDYIENTCESCGDLCACEGDVDCRLWRYRGQEHTAAPVDLVVAALLRAIVAGEPQSDGDDAYRLSTNVRNFFTGPNEESGDASTHGCGC